MGKKKDLLFYNSRSKLYTGKYVGIQKNDVPNGEGTFFDEKHNIILKDCFPNNEILLGEIFKYCNKDRQLSCQSTNDVDTLSLFATDNRNIIQNFQYTMNQMKDETQDIPDILVFGKGKQKM